MLISRVLLCELVKSIGIEYTHLLKVLLNVYIPEEIGRYAVGHQVIVQIMYFVAIQLLDIRCFLLCILNVLYTPDPTKLYCAFDLYRSFDELVTDVVFRVKYATKGFVLDHVHE